LLTKQHQEDKIANLNSYKLKMADYAGKYVNYSQDVQTIKTTLGSSAQQKQACVDALVGPVKPRFECHPNPLTTSQEKRAQEISTT
jgi:hypothetical protein